MRTRQTFAAVGILEGHWAGPGVRIHEKASATRAAGTVELRRQAQPRQHGDAGWMNPFPGEALRRVARVRLDDRNARAAIRETQRRHTADGPAADDDHLGLFPCGRGHCAPVAPRRVIGNASALDPDHALEWPDALRLPNLVMRVDLIARTLRRTVEDGGETRQHRRHMRRGRVGV